MTLAVLEDYLAEFKGCVIVVSHDRYFLDRVADHLFVFEGDGNVRDFPGDYSTYRHCVASERKLAREKSDYHKIIPPEANQRRREPSKPRLSFKEKREMEQLEVEMEALGKERRQLEDTMNSGTLDHVALAKAGKRIEEIISRTDEAELRYLELLEKN